MEFIVANFIELALIKENIYKSNIVKILNNICIMHLKL